MGKIGHVTPTRSRHSADRARTGITLTHPAPGQHTGGLLHAQMRSSTHASRCHHHPRSISRHPQRADIRGFTNAAHVRRPVQAWLPNRFRGPGISVDAASHNDRHDGHAQRKHKREEQRTSRRAHPHVRVPRRSVKHTDWVANAERSLLARVTEVDAEERPRPAAPLGICVFGRECLAQQAPQPHLVLGENEAARRLVAARHRAARALLDLAQCHAPHLDLRPRLLRPRRLGVHDNVPSKRADRIRRLALALAAPLPDKGGRRAVDEQERRKVGETLLVVLEAGFILSLMIDVGLGDERERWRIRLHRQAVLAPHQPIVRALLTAQQPAVAGVAVEVPADPL
mmetsp:Transcript_94339/g.282878  ORF Transcript_94339/g.282878 Transcript_94339/m.282878 type:complete len:342 (-) Transcript_94339:300-1325(-)